MGEASGNLRLSLPNHDLNATFVRGGFKFEVQRQPAKQVEA
jgi:hypothetical protein